MVATFRQPFDMLAETVTEAARLGANETPKSAKSEIWLGDLDSTPHSSRQIPEQLQSTTRNFNELL